MRPVVFVGLISYSLYLWHWPVLAFSRYVSLTPLTPGQRVVLLCLGLGCAILSWRYVETPFRARKFGGSLRSMYAFAGSGLAVVLGCGLLCVITQGFPTYLPSQTRRYADAKSDRAFINEVSREDLLAGRLIPIGVPDPTLHPEVLVWGDSHAMAALPAVDALLKEKGLAGRAATHSATAPILDWYKIRKNGLGKDAIAYNDSVFSYIRSRHIPEVMLIARWEGYTENNGDDGDDSDLNSALVATVQRLVAIGARPWIMLEVPNHSFDVPKALFRPIYSRAYIASLCAKPTRWNELDKRDPNILGRIEGAGGRVLDPKARFLDPSGQRYIVEANGVALYCDAHHLTTKGAKLMLLPLLRSSMTFAPVKERVAGSREVAP